MVKTSIILPVWNRADLTMQFLNRYWQLYGRRLDIQVVVVDNGSTDLTTLILTQWKKVLIKRIKVIRNDENKGFGAANNQGAQAASGNILIFISNDVVAAGDYVTLIEQRSVGASILFGAELLSHDTGWNRFNSPQGEIIIPYLAGWCVACNRPTWERLGGWDEQYYPSDYEDIDLSYTAAGKGIECIAIPLPLHHISGQSARQIKGGRLAVTQRSRASFMEKWGLCD